MPCPGVSLPGPRAWPGRLDGCSRRSCSIRAKTLTEQTGKQPSKRGDAQRGFWEGYRSLLSVYFCGILAPQPGIRPLTVKASSPNHWIGR